MSPQNYSFHRLIIISNLLPYLLFSLEGGMRTSFFINITKTNLVVVKKWDAYNETFFDSIDEEEAYRYTLGVQRFDFDQYLGIENSIFL